MSIYPTITSSIIKYFYEYLSAFLMLWNIHLTLWIWKQINNHYLKVLKKLTAHNTKNYYSRYLASIAGRNPTIKSF